MGRETLVARDTEITAAEWIEVRQRIVTKIKDAGSRQERSTLQNHVEALMVAGYIDIGFIASEIRQGRETIVAELEPLGDD